MRALIVVPVVLALSAALGFAACRALGVEPGNREMWIAFAIVMAASLLAAVPGILVRGSSQYAMSQAGLVGTIVQMFAAIGAGGFVFLKLQPGPSFLYWLAGLYWAGLIALVVCFVAAVKSAPPEPPLATPPTSKQ